MKIIKHSSLIFLFVLISLCAFSQQQNETDPWWKHAVIYEIYPRSFQDSNGDGVGDLKGIISRLDYLRELGVDAIWLTPMSPSPQVDFGYDVSDYTAIDPQYGTMDDFDHLIAEAKKKNIRIIVDLVANHTSDQHAWFLESRSSRDNPKRDWYIWKDGKANGQPPNNWLSWFGGSAWKLDPKTGQYYYHYFYTEQPDLNWRNPAVRKAMYDVMRFWLNRGAAGFRIDAISRLFEDSDLRDEKILPGTDSYGNPKIEHKYTDNLPEVHDVLKEIRKLVDGYPNHPVLISEADEPNITELTKMYGNNDEVQLPMDFQLALVNRLSAPQFRKLLDEIDTNSAKGQPYFFFSNHDQMRQWDRYGDGAHNDNIAKITATLLLTTRATPQLYYGEEIGMVTTVPERREDVKDPVGRSSWPIDKGRDGERTPMQWNATPNAGFSSAEKTWLPVPASFKVRNVEAERKDPNSILSFYKKLIQLRRNQPALQSGSYQPLNEDDPHVLSWLRKNTGDGDSVIIVLNMSNASQKIAFDLKTYGIQQNQAQILLSNPVIKSNTVPLNEIQLPPYAVFIAAVK
ncbi:MAG: glucohydrolase [Acidobacteria bacterium]|nr:MAG: glucohydrolase [Acidobacteriota bacterium]